jgi:uncharacterized glyoxalase superfamily metalloenzyme YdcJ
MTEISERFQGILYFWINFQSSIFKTEASAIDCLASIYEICEGHEARARVENFDGPFVNEMLAGPKISAWFKEIEPRQMAVKEKDLLKYMALLEKANLDIDQIKEDVKSDEKMALFVENVKKEMETLKATKASIDEYKKVKADKRPTIAAEEPATDVKESATDVKESAIAAEESATDVKEPAIAAEEPAIADDVQSLSRDSNAELSDEHVSSHELHIESSSNDES